MNGHVPWMIATQSGDEVEPGNKHEILIGEINGALQKPRWYQKCRKTSTVPLIENTITQVKRRTTVLQ
jgi:hypothetical protein